MNSDEIAQQLESIRAKAGGELTPGLVVDAARNPTHPLHNRFEWDDSEAAEAWRRQQARVLIASVQVIVQRTTPRGVRDVSVRRYASAVVHERRQYVPVSEIKASPELSAQVLDEIRCAIGALKRKYADYGNVFAQALQAELDLANSDTKAA